MDTTDKLMKKLERLLAKCQEERYLNLNETAKRFGMSRQKFTRSVDTLVAMHNLERTRSGGQWVYREASVNRIIKHTAEKSVTLV